MYMYLIIIYIHLCLPAIPVLSYYLFRIVYHFSLIHALIKFTRVHTAYTLTLTMTIKLLHYCAGF